MKFISTYGSLRVALLAGVGAAAMFAQTAGDVDTFTQEARVPLTSINYLGTPNISPTVFAAITGGALEIREVVTYSSTAKTLNIRGFLVQPGAPASTPTAAQTTVFEDFTADVQTITQGSVPRNTVTMVGTVKSAAVASPFGNLVGAPIIYTFGYVPAATGTTVAVSGSTLVVPGVYVAFAPTSTATLTFKTTSSGNGTGGTGTGTGGTGTGGTGTGGTGTTPPANRAPLADAGGNLQTSDLQVTLDGSKSSDPDGDAISYSWRAVNRSASILQPTSARPIVQFSEGFGDYIFELTVTDAKGLSSTAQVTISYFGFNFN